MNEKGLAPIFLLLASIGVIIFIVIAGYTPFKNNLYDVLYRKTDSKAAETPPFGSNPKSDLINFPKPSYPVQIGFVYGVTSLSQLSAEEVNFIGGEVDYFFFDQASLARSLDGTGTYQTKYDQSDLYAQMKVLKNAAYANGRTLKVGSHGGMPFGAAPFHILFNYLGDPKSPEVEQYFLHRGGSPVMYNGHWQIRDYNINSETTRNKIIFGWAKLFDDHPELDSVFLDGMMFPSSQLFSELSTSCDEGNCDNKWFWASPLISVSQHLKAQANSRGREAFYNGIFEVPDNNVWRDATKDPSGINLNAGFTEYSDGTLAEHFHTIIQSPQTFKKYMDGLKWITGQNEQSSTGNKKVFVWTQPQTFCVVASQGKSINCPGDYFTVNGVNYPLNLDTQRFYLASYLLIEKNPYTYFGYNPGTFYTLPSYFYSDWNKDFGAPQGEFVGPSDGNGLYLRSLLNSLVVVNPTDGPLPLHLPVTGLKIWDPIDGETAAQDITIPPKSGKVFFNPRNQPTVTVKGRLFNKLTNQPLPAGILVRTCPHSGIIAETVTDSNGEFSFQITRSHVYCVGGPELPGYSPTIEAVNAPSEATVKTEYAFQVAGYNCTGSDGALQICQNNKEDRNTDIGFDLAYTPLVTPDSTPTPAPTPTPKPSPSNNPLVCSPAISKTSKINSASSVTWNYSYPSTTKITGLNFPAMSGIKYTVGTQTAPFGQALNSSLGTGTSGFNFTVTTSNDCSKFTVPFTINNLTCGQIMSDFVGMGSKSAYGSFCK